MVITALGVCSLLVLHSRKPAVGSLFSGLEYYAMDYIQLVYVIFEERFSLSMILNLARLRSRKDISACLTRQVSKKERKK